MVASSWVRVGVGVEAPAPELEAREEAPLGTGVQRFSPDDEPGASRELGVADERGQLAHRGPLPQLAVLTQGRLPHLFQPDGVGDGGGDLGVLSGGDVEGDVAVCTGREEPFGTAGRVGLTTTSFLTSPWSSPTRWPRAIASGSWAMAWSRTVTWSATVRGGQLTGLR